MPSAAWTATAVAGKVLSGVEVASTIRSIDCASMPALASAALRRLDRQMRGELALGGDVALPDAGALHDPLVRRVDLRAASSALVRTRSRQIGAAAEHDRTYCSHETASCAVGAEPARCRRD